MAVVAPLTKEICLLDAAIIDRLVLSTARSLGQRLLTFDVDFEGE
jgi:hypothetical protein